MTASYDPIKNQQSAMDLLEQITLETFDIEATRDYEAAMNPDEWDSEPSDADKALYVHWKRCQELKAALSEYLRED